MAWYNSSWLKRQKVTVASSQVDADLTDYPVFLDLEDMNSGFLDNVRIDGRDIRVTKSDGTTEVPVEVVSIFPKLVCTGGTWGSGADTVETVPASTDGAIYFTAHTDLQGSDNYFMGGFTAEADSPATGYSGIDFALYVHIGALRVFESGTEVHNETSYTAGDTVSIHRDGGTGAITYKKNGTTFYTSGSTSTVELKGDFVGLNANDYISDIAMYDGTSVFAPTFDNLTNMTYQPGDMEVHFLADGTLSSSSDTDFYVYYDNGSASAVAASATYGSQNVWVDYEHVYHLNQDPSGPATSILDSTSNGYDSNTISGSMTSSDLVAGKVGNGIEFDGSNDRIEFDPSNILDNITCQVWIDCDGSQGLFFAQDSQSGNGRKWYMQHSGGRYYVNAFESGTPLVRKNYNVATTQTNMNLYHWNYTTTGDVLKLHENGSLTTPTKTFDTTLASLEDTTSNLSIGSNLVSNYAGAIIDEARVSSVVRSDDWISTEYNNQNSPGTFYTVGTEETESVGGSESPALAFGANF